MTTRVFYPPNDLPERVLAYANGLKVHKADYGEVPQNAAAELKPVVAAAEALEPLADEIKQLELTLAAKLDKYHQAAAPVWASFSEKLGYARVFAEKNHKTALAGFLRGFQHHTRGREPKKVAAPAAPAAPAPSNG